MDFGLARYWWVVALRGLLAIAFGIVAFFWPLIALMAVIYIFAVYALVDGVFALGAAVSGGPRPAPLWALILEGVAGIAFGVLTLAWPWAAVVDVVLLVYFIAGWLIATGILQVIAAVRLRRYIQGEWALVVAGILSVLLGIGYLFFPGAGLLVTALWLGAYSIVFGALMLALAFRLRGLVRHSERRGTFATPGGRASAALG